MEFPTEILYSRRAIAAFIGGAVACFYAAARSRAPRRTADGIVLEMPLRFASIASAVFIFGVYVWLWSGVVGLGRQMLPVWIGIALVGGYFVKRMYAVRHELHDRGFRYATRFHGRESFHWFDVIEIRYDRFKSALEFGLRGGITAAFSTELVGFAHLCRAALDNAPPEARIDDDARELLHTAADASS